MPCDWKIEYYIQAGGGGEGVDEREKPNENIFSFLI